MQQGDVKLKLKTASRYETTRLAMSSPEFSQRLAAKPSMCRRLVPRLARDVRASGWFLQTNYTNQLSLKGREPVAAFFESFRSISAWPGAYANDWFRRPSILVLAPANGRSLEHSSCSIRRTRTAATGSYVDLTSIDR